MGPLRQGEKGRDIHRGIGFAEQTESYLIPNSAHDEHKNPES